MKPTAPLSDDEFSHLVQQSVRQLPDAPLALQQLAIGLWPAATATTAFVALAQGVAAHLVAVLTFDSWAVPASAAGMRSVASPTRHLLFSALGRDIDLRITGAAHGGGLWALAGQILGPDESGQVELVAQAATAADAPAVRLTTLDELGEFHLDGLHRGSYVMTLRLGARAIVLPPVDVGEPAA